MSNNLSNPLEELEKIPGSVVSQLVKLPGDIVSSGVKAILGKQNAGKPKVDPLTGVEIPTSQRVQQLQKREKKQRQSGLAMMRQTLSSQTPQKPKTPKMSDLPAYIVGKPGFSQDKMQKRMQGIETEKRELPPPVSAVKQKFSTGERKHGVRG